MNPQKWIENPAGYLELIDSNSGEVLQREKRQSLPRQVRVGGRKPGRPRLTEVKSTDPGRARRLYPFDPVIGDLICDAVVVGGLLTSLDPAPGFPPYQEICRWRREHADFDRKIRLALECRAIQFEELALTVAEEVQNQANVPAAKLKIDALKWAAMMSNPTRYTRRVPEKKTEERAVQYIVDTGVPEPTDWE